MHYLIKLVRLKRFYIKLPDVNWGSCPRLPVLLERVVPDLAGVPATGAGSFDRAADHAVPLEAGRRSLSAVLEDQPPSTA